MPIYRSALFILLASLILSPISNAKEKSKDKGPRLEKQSAPDCRALTDQCAICSDGKMRASATKKGDKEAAELQLTPYICATKGKSQLKKIRAKKIAANIKDCKVLSDFCAVCKDDSFVFTNDGSKITSDLYECATTPRTHTGENHSSN